MSRGEILATPVSPIRILWHKAVAAKYPYYDISRVGIYGTSAGGQSSTGGLLFHPEFYKAAVSNSGCHDNRMDKIWWNEQWMGWPLGPTMQPHQTWTMRISSKANSFWLFLRWTQTSIRRRRFRRRNALIKANKKHDLLFVPGGGHGAGGAYGNRLLYDFFVHHLLGLEPPDWNRIVNKSEPAPVTGQR